MKQILLFYPPWALNAEPPLGLSMIQGYLHTISTGMPVPIRSRIVDLNALAAWRIPGLAEENGTPRRHRAILHRDPTLDALSGPSGYRSISTYKNTMSDYAELLSAAFPKMLCKLSPADFTDSIYPDFDPQTIRRLMDLPRHPILEDLYPHIENVVTEHVPDTVGISIIYRSQFSAAIALASWFLRHFHHLHVVLGGPFLSCLSSDSLETIGSSGLSICAGRGESYFRDCISGLAGSAGVDVPDTGFPEQDFTGIEPDRYFAPARVLPMISARGCYWSKCSFCDECRDTFNMDSSVHLIQRIKNGLCAHKPGLVHFCDHAIPPAVLKTLIGLREPFDWYGFVRATPELANPDFIGNLAESGCRMLQLGLESYDPELLQAMNKGVDPELFPVIIDNCRKHGIRSYAYLLFGYPGQTIRHCEETLAAIESMPPDFINSAVFRLPPGAPLVHNVAMTDPGCSIRREQGRLYYEIPDRTLPLSNLRRWLSQRFNSSRVIREVNKKTPHFYKSSHAVYF